MKQMPISKLIKNQLNRRDLLVTEGLSVSEVTYEAYRKLLKHGNRLKSDKGETIELNPHMLILHDSNQPYTILPRRKNNPVATIAETLWVFAGRSEVISLSKWLPRAKNYSDDGQTWRAGYGPRLIHWPRRRAGPLNQIEVVLQRLRKSRASRQAIIAIYDPDADSIEHSKDYPCLAGDTIIRSPEGDTPIEELARKFSRSEVTRYPVYSWNPETRKTGLSWCTNVWQSGVKKTLKLTFDDGSTMRLTPDHRLYKKFKAKDPDGKPKATKTFVEEIEAGKLKVGDRVWAMPFLERQGRTHFIRNLSKGWKWENQIRVSREYYEFVHGKIPDGFDIHHKNENMLDDSIRNLESRDHGEHSSYHMKKGNPMKDPEVAARKGKTQSKVIQEHYDNMSSEEREEFRGSIRKGVDSYWNDPSKVEERESMLEKRGETLSRKLSTPEGKRIAHERAKKGWKTRLKNKELVANHVIVSIEEGFEEPVYDFTVPGNHNAVVGTGVIAHNCNNLIQFIIRDGKLNMHTTVRSNDAVFGICINLFEWIFLWNYLADQLNVLPGKYTHTANSFHIYGDFYDRAREVRDAYVKVPVLPGRLPVYHPDLSPKEWSKWCEKVYMTGGTEVQEEAPGPLANFSRAMYAHSIMEEGLVEDYVTYVGHYITDSNLKLSLLEYGQRHFKSPFGQKYAKNIKDEQVVIWLNALYKAHFSK